MNWAAFGCSFTKYRWFTWADFLKINVRKFKNYGMPGSSNEYICRQVLKNAKKHNSIIVMWSGYDRVHTDPFLDQHGFNPGQCRDCVIPLTQLLERSLEYIWLANHYCKINNIKIYNFSMTVLETGETKKIIPMPDYLDIEHKQWPIDMTQYCLDNPSKFTDSIQDDHPLPSQHYNYLNDVMSPIIGVNIKEISRDQLDQFDKKAIDNT